MTKNSLLVLVLSVAAGLLIGVVYYTGSSGKSNESANTLSRAGEGFQSRFVSMHSTTASGTAQIEPVEGGLTLELSLEGLTPGKRYNAHYHRGTCRSPGGGGLQLNPVTSTDAGTGVSWTRLAYDDFNSTFDHLIMVHAPDQEHILCGDVPSVNRLKEVRDLNRQP